MDPFNKDVERQLLLIKIASRWYLKFYTSKLSAEEMWEYINELKLYKINEKEENIIKEKMAEYYITLLEDKIEDLERKLNGGNK